MSAFCVEISDPLTKSANVGPTLADFGPTLADFPQSGLKQHQSIPFHLRNATNHHRTRFLPSKHHFSQKIEPVCQCAPSLPIYNGRLDAHWQTCPKSTVSTPVSLLWDRNATRHPRDLSDLTCSVMAWLFAFRSPTVSENTRSG